MRKVIGEVVPSLPACVSVVQDCRIEGFVYNMKFFFLQAMVHCFLPLPGGDSAVIIDGPAGGVVAAGEQLALTCYSVNSEGLQLQWLKDGQVLNVSKGE